MNRRNPRVSILSISLAAACLAAACASSTPVSITKSDAMVTGCAKLADVTVDKKIPESDVNDALAAEARKQNGNYVVVASDGARTGVAYHCTSPAISATR
jgi:hypothetical protein